ncbi:hypothetical protein Tco_0859185 [Tanacetum coccineum]|uniref:SWIM-type domain-containing protein n=1 Tax=Tanacetum coccineum TaxID=301880 RepID=A0ABQ5BC91_9ASTR
MSESFQAESRLWVFSTFTRGGFFLTSISLAIIVGQLVVAPPKCILEMGEAFPEFNLRRFINGKNWCISFSSLAQFGLLGDKFLDLEGEVVTKEESALREAEINYPKMEVRGRRRSSTIDHINGVEFPIAIVSVKTKNYCEYSSQAIQCRHLFAVMSRRTGACQNMSIRKAISKLILEDFIEFMSICLSLIRLFHYNASKDMEEKTEGPTGGWTGVYCVNKEGCTWVLCHSGCGPDPEARRALLAESLKGGKTGGSKYDLNHLWSEIGAYLVVISCSACDTYSEMFVPNKRAHEWSGQFWCRAGAEQKLWFSCLRSNARDYIL